MAVHTVVAILIAVGEVSSPTQATTDAMTGAVAEALGPATSLVLRTTPATSDDQALAVERELGAAAVARVVWDGPDQTVGVLRAHLHSSDRWFERRVSFSTADSRAERGRTLGFAFASLLLMAQEEAQAIPPPRPVPSTRSSLEASPGTPASVVKAAAPAEASPVSASERTLAIELAALVATGIGGPAEGLGAALHAEWAVHGRFFARAGAMVRAGPVPGLDGEDALAVVGAGVAFRPRVPQAGKGAFGLGFTLEALGLYQDLSHRTAGGSTLHEGRLQAGMSGGVEGSWSISHALDLFAGLGGEVVFGTTEVTVAGRHVASIPAFRPTALAGLRWHD
jgi:hypothetical protein